MMVITLCLCSTMQLSLAAQLKTLVTFQCHQVIFSVSGHFSTNVSYYHVKTHANKTQRSHNNMQTSWDLPTRVVPTIWIVVATVLSLTIVLTLGISGGIKIYFQRKLIHQHNKGNYDDIMFGTNTGHNRIPRNYVHTDSEVKSSPVRWKIKFPNVT